MPVYTVTIPEYDELAWENTDGGISWEVSFNGIELAVTTIDGGLDINIWHDGNLCDGIDIDWDDLKDIEDAKEVAYTEGVGVLHEALVAMGAEAEDE